MKLGNADLALRDYKQAIDIYHSLENKSGVVFCLLGIGNAHNQLLEFEEAWRSLQTAYDLGMDIGQKSVVKEILLSITQTCKGLCNYEAALHYYEQFVELDRELTGQEVKTQLANLNFKHKLEQKEKESEIERLKNVELKNALHELKEEKEKSDRLLENQLAELKSTALQAQMNPHFVFNSLNAIQHYIWKSDPKKATDYLASFAKLIRLILENSRQSRVSLDKDLLALDYYIQLEALRFENEFTYQIICDPAVNKEEIMIPPMILQPFVENAIIHGLHPSKVAGKLTIAIKKEGEDVLLIKVEDNGIGRSGSAQLSASLRPAAHHSLGMQITEQRVEKMNGLKAGKIWVRDLFNKANLPCGTVIEIELPI